MAVNTQPARVESLPGAHNITRETLPNGITVLVYENHAAQSVVISGSLRAGALHETPAQNGLASLTAAALMRGTGSRDFTAIHAALEDIGADISVSGGNHRVNFSGKSLAEDLPTLLDVLGDVLRRPTFPAADVERLRGEVITGLQIRAQDTRYRASRAFHEALYPADHPYHYSVRGSIETVKSLAVDDLASFHQRHYGPDGMILVIVGAVKADDALGTVRAMFESWHNPDQPTDRALPTVPARRDKEMVRVALPGKTQSDIVLGVVGPSRAATDYQAAQLANSIVGQFGMMGRIGRSVREELGLAYYAYSQIDAGLGAGPWMVSAGVNPANVELAIDRIEEELRRLVNEPVSADDLSDNQSYFVGHLPLQLETNEGLAGTIHNMELYSLGLDYLRTYRDRIMALTADDLLAAARRYLNPDGLVIAVAGP
jgi:zinc protease